MSKWRCDDPRLWRLFLLLLTIAALLAALFLYLVGLTRHAGFLYSIAVLLLLVFALAGAVALAFLAYALFRRWCELRGRPPKGQGTRESSGPPSVHLPSTIYKRPDPLIYSQYFLMAQGFAVSWDNPDIWLTELPAADGSMAPVASSALKPNHPYRVHALVHTLSFYPRVCVTILADFPHEYLLSASPTISPTVSGPIWENVPSSDRAVTARLPMVLAGRASD
jgi:threonine/homoserine/homoserine lactone efflux protein